MKQYLGAFDWLGRARSSLGVEHESVPGAGHHLNPSFPYAMSVAALLNDGVQPRLLPKPPRVEPVDSVSIPHAAAAGSHPTQGEGAGSEAGEEIGKTVKLEGCSTRSKGRKPSTEGRTKSGGAGGQATPRSGQGIERRCQASCRACTEESREGAIRLSSVCKADALSPKPCLKHPANKVWRGAARARQ